MAGHSTEPPHLDLLRDLSRVKHAFLMGGFAEDALLGGATSRPRSDVDLLIEAGDWVHLLAELRGAGLSQFSPMIVGPGGRTLVYACDEREIPVEVWIAERTPAGYTMTLPGIRESGASGFFQLQLPSDTFDLPRSTLDGLAVQTVSPLALAILRAASSQTRGTPQKRAEDRKVLQQLTKAYLRDPSELTLILTVL